jgi:hypothetical protein
VFMKSNVSHRLYEIPQFDSIQHYSSQSTSSNSHRMYILLFSSVGGRDLLSGLFPRHILINFLHEFLLPPLCAACFAHGIYFLSVHHVIIR